MDRNDTLGTKKPITTPVLFLIFCRPDTTQRVFNEIRQAKPTRLFVAADGPRSDRPGEAEKCQACRDIIKQIDWQCEVYTNFQENNLGLKLSVSSAITWFFAHVEEGIILEDDCLPSQSFFWFCQELLEKYCGDERIMGITGDNFQDGRNRGDGTYYFSRLATIWGWATWRRAWKLFDLESKTFPLFRAQNQINNLFQDKTAQDFWMSKIQDACNGANTWGFHWVYAVLANNGLFVTPNINLISNCGFGPDSVHAVDPNSRFANISAMEMDFILHPTFRIPNCDADAYFSRTLASEQMAQRSLGQLTKSVLKSLLGAEQYERFKRKLRLY